MNEIVFYGQDYSPIDRSYYFEGTKLKKTNSDPDKIRLLRSALEEINKKLNSPDESARIVVGQTLLDDDKNIDNRKKRKFEISNTVFENGENIIKFGPLVGTVTVQICRKLVKIIIFSRFDKINESEPKKTSPFFLASMLLKGKLKFHDQKVEFSYNNLFDFYMLWLLKQHFMEAVRKGFFKKYQRFERNDDRVRGTIDISRHIRFNMGLNNGKIAYSYRENSVDNPINHLILTAYDYLKEKYPDMVENNTDYELEQVLKELKYTISYPKYSRRSILSLNQMPIAHPFFTECEELRKDCLKIMRDEGVSPFESDAESLDGILYYVPDLWEEYLQDAFERKCRDFNRALYYYDDDNNGFSFKLSVKAQERIYIMTNMDNDKNTQNTSYPDFVFSYEEQKDDPYDSEQEKVSFCILDAKYKPEWKYGLEGLLLPKLREDYDKCIRDMESVNGTATGVVFPVKSEELEKIESNPSYIHRFSCINKMKRFYTIPIIVPEVTNEIYHEWDKKMSDNINDIMSQIIKLLKFEACLHQEMKKATEDIMHRYRIKEKTLIETY